MTPGRPSPCDRPTAAGWWRSFPTSRPLARSSTAWRCPRAVDPWSVPEDEPIVARFRADVPAGVLIPHILAMFGGMMIATRALLEVLRPARPMPRGAGADRHGCCSSSAGCSSVRWCRSSPSTPSGPAGPSATDLTDNKTALAVLAWLPATLLALRGRRAPIVVVMGWIVMMGVFLIPHSLRGSEIDWSEHPAASTPSRATLVSLSGFWAAPMDKVLSLRGHVRSLLSRTAGEGRYLVVRSGRRAFAIPAATVAGVHRDLAVYPVPGGRAPLLGLSPARR